MKESTTERVRELVEPVLEKYDAFLVEITARGERNTKIIEIFIDTEKGVDVKSISDINKEINRRLADEDIIPGIYRVNVSSPGLDKPLRIVRQYKKNIGRDLEVHFLVDGQSQKEVGTLVGADDTAFTLKFEGETTKNYNYNSIQKAFIKLPW